MHVAIIERGREGLMLLLLLLVLNLLLCRLRLLQEMVLILSGARCHRTLELGRWLLL